MNLELIQQLYDYNYAMHRRLWESIVQLTDAQFVEDIPYSIGSVRNHMVHLNSVDERWLARVKQTELPPRTYAEDFKTIAEVHAKYTSVEADILAIIAQLTPADLIRELEYTVRRHTTPRRNTVAQILVHVVNHGTDHRAQVLPILKRMGVPTFEQDYMLYLWDNQS